jgi:hypothetical protein
VRHSYREGGNAVRRLATLLLLTFVLACRKTETPAVQQPVQDTSTVAESTSTPPATRSSKPPAPTAPVTTDTATSSTFAVVDTGASGFPDLGAPPPNASAEKPTQKPKQAYVYLVDTFYDWPPGVPE